jgi:hypothetical protein
VDIEECSDVARRRTQQRQKKGSQLETGGWRETRNNSAGRVEVTRLKKKKRRRADKVKVTTEKDECCRRRKGNETWNGFEALYRVLDQDETETDPQ